MSRVSSASIDIAAPAATVFAILVDPRQHSRIDGSGSVRDTVSGPERLSRGATFRVDMKLGGFRYKIDNRVVEFEEGRLLAWRHFGGHRWRYELEPTADDATRVTESFDYSMYAAPQRVLIEALGFPARNLRGIEATLQTLKEAAEADHVQTDLGTHPAGR